MEDNNEKYYIYLDGLRESGVTNMFAATPYLMNEFEGLSQQEVKDILMQWMNTFSERHK